MSLVLTCIEQLLHTRTLNTGGRRRVCGGERKREREKTKQINVNKLLLIDESQVFYIICIEIDGSAAD